MATISSYRNALVQLANRYSATGWACDLVCKAILNDGVFTDGDIDDIANSLNNGAAAALIPPANANVETIPVIELKSLKHIRGVNALADNQELIFCKRYFTIIYGLNASGKSSYFKLLNNIASGLHHYEIRNNIYNPAPSQEVQLVYSIDGVETTWSWDLVSATPDKLKYIRVFDTNYANDLLQVQANGDYVFNSFTLGQYRGIVKVVNALKERGLPIPPPIEADLCGLCDPAYQQLLVNKLTDQFNKEKENLGLNGVNVTLEVDDFMDAPSIYLHINNTYYPNDILSEGELKGVALAMFLAECEIQTIKTPLIFDDPVNSLDSRIMGKFVKRMKELPNQVILFTHNLQLLELMKENKSLFRIYKNNVTNYGLNPTFKPAYGYKLKYDSAGLTGKVYQMEENETEDSLNKANAILADLTSNPEDAIPHLRYAVENMVDEVIFKKQTPLKYRGRGFAQWNEYKKIVSLPANVIDDMEDAYGQLSNAGTLHLGATAMAAPLTRVDLQNISTTLRDIIDNYS